MLEGDLNEPLLSEKPMQKSLSLYEKKQLERFYVAKFEEPAQVALPQKQTFAVKIKGILFKNQYFDRLFPSIKEQKPGKDLYAAMATTQFIICIYMIFFFTQMDADITNVTEAITYNSFSGQMVIALFLQILIMILDRYLYRSKTFVVV